MKRSMNCLAALIFSVSLLAGSTVAAYADDGSERGYTYNYDYWGDVQYSPDAYSTVDVYTAADLGLNKGFNAPAGLYVQGDDVYICDTGNNRIVQLKRENKNVFKLIRVIDEIKGDVEVRTFLNPTDICVTKDGYLYICDKGNNRILKLDDDLNFVMMFQKPDNVVFDQSAVFLPNKLEVDAAGRVYCIADNINKGMIKYDAEGTFTGFYGASQVTYNFSDYMWKKFASKAQRAAMESFVPTEYDNIYMDTEGFIFACTTNVSDRGMDTGSDVPIRRLNLMGQNILIQNGNYRVMGDLYWGLGGGYKGPSLITDITALDHGIYFAIDKVRGRMFGYDKQGHMLYAFGGNGNLNGSFKLPSAIDHMGNDLLVLDSQDASLTVFTPTEYGNLIYQAITEYDAGDYTNSGKAWEKVKAQNGNYDLAYVGIGTSLMSQEKYKEAMKYFELKWDTKNYSKAFKQYRKAWVEEHIGLLFTGVILLFVLPTLIERGKKIKYQIDTAEIFKE